ncbi:hypothetical protein [Candidatus Darwinibacter acetoxidans]
MHVPKAANSVFMQPGKDLAGPEGRYAIQLALYFFWEKAGKMPLSLLHIQTSTSKGEIMSKRPAVHFLTAYVEYLLDQGIRSEEYYLGDASRFLRFLLASTTPDQVETYIHSHASPAYRARLEKTLRKFFAFAQEKLAIETAQIVYRQKKPDQDLVQ